MSAEALFLTQGFAPGVEATAHTIAMLAASKRRREKLDSLPKPTEVQAVRFRAASKDRLTLEKLGWFDNCKTGRRRRGKCGGCGKYDIVAKYEYTCGLALCPKCWVGRYFADWHTSRISLVLPENCALIRLRPRRQGTLSQVMSRARRWLERQGLTATNGGVWGYGVTRQGPTDFDWFPTLIMDAGKPLPRDSRDWHVEVDYGPRGRAFEWQSRHYRDMLDVWSTPDELDYLAKQVGRKRRFQSFGLLYDALVPLTAEDQEESNDASGTNREDPDVKHNAACRCSECRQRKNLGKPVPANHAGGDGSFALKHRRDICPYCGGVNTIKWNQGLTQLGDDIVFNPARPDVLGIVKRKR